MRPSILLALLTGLLALVPCLPCDRGRGALTAAAPPEDNLRERLPRIPPREPPDALKTFRVLDGFRMELLAAEPLVTDPVAMDYDEDGRAYVVEMRDYPYTDKASDKPFTERTTDLPLGRIRILEDTDGDGVFDRSTVFAENLSWPTGLAFWKGGVFVTATPDVWYLKDTDGDRKADVRRKVFTGFRKFNVQAVINNLKWGLDHRIYGAGATNGGQVRKAEEPEAKPLLMTARDFRFDPRTEALELLSGGARFGNAFDDWGNRFICNIRNPVQHVVLPSHYLARNPFLPVRSALHDAAPAGDTLPVYRASPPEPWRVLNAQRLARDTTRVSPRSESTAAGYVTSACGVTIYRGSAYPARYYGNVFLGEVSGNLVHRQTLAPQGVTFTATRADANTEFVTSTDNWFRPVNFVNAPDGTLHLLDMYRETIEHPWSIPDDIKAHLDLESGRDRGRIYRLTPPGFRVPPPPRLGSATTEQLVAVLENPNAWWRGTAHRLLFERQDRAAEPLLRKLLQAHTPPAARSPDVKALGRLHALYSLEGLGCLTEADLRAALEDPVAGIREHAVLLAEPRLEQSPALRDRVLALAGDEAVRVRFQVALTLGTLADARVTGALAGIARRDAEDDWVRTALLSSATDRAGELLRTLLADQAFTAPEARSRTLRELAVVVGAANRPGDIERVLDAAAARPAKDRADVVVGVADGLRRTGKSLAKVLPRADAPAVRVVAELLAAADRTARDEKANLEARLEAVQLLGCAELARVQATLTGLLDARQPQPVQTTAVRALAGYRGSDVSRILLAGYRGFTPAVRSAVVEALASRPEWIEPLLDAVEARTVPVADIPLTRRTLLSRHSNVKLRDRAVALFGREPVSNRKDVVEHYRAALSLPADPERGLKVYQRECQACHRLGDQGIEVGPNLATVQHRTPAEVLLHVLDPNREVSPQYLEFVVALTDGRVTRGVIVAETPTGLTFGRSDGTRETILRQSIEELTSTGLSLMPEGLEKNIGVQDMADLLAFVLKGSGSGPGAGR